MQKRTPDARQSSRVRRETPRRREGKWRGRGQAQAQDVEGQDPLGPQGEKASRRLRGRTGGGPGFCREKEALNGQNNSVNGSENDVGPIGAVPEAGENHGQEERSEERRVGKECRYRWMRKHNKK